MFKFSTYFVLTFFLISCGNETRFSAPPPSSPPPNSFKEQGLKFLTLNPEDSNSLWTFDREAMPEEKIIDSTLFPGKFGPSVPFSPELNEYLVFFKVGDEWHLYKLSITEKSLIKLKEFDQNQEPRFDNNFIGFTFSKFRLFFAGTEDQGYELWRSDGTEEGTFLVKDIFPGIDSGVSTSSSDKFFFNGYYYFEAKDKDNNLQLWKSDGTTQGTSEVSDFNNLTSFDVYTLGNESFISFSGHGVFQLLNSHTLKHLTNLTSLQSHAVRLNDFIIQESPGASVISYNLKTNEILTLFSLSSDSQNRVDILGKSLDKVYFLAKDGSKISLYSTQGSSDSTLLIGDITNNATRMYHNVALFNDLAAPLILTLDHTDDNKENPQVYKVIHNQITNITDHILNSFDISWEEYNIYFLSACTFSNNCSNEGGEIKYYHNGEYKFMVSNVSENFFEMKTYLGKTHDFLSYTLYAETRPDLIVDALSGLQYAYAILYGKFYYNYTYYEVDNKVYYLNNYFYPSFDM